MTNENQSEKAIKLMALSKDALAGMICSKDNEIVRLKDMLAEYDEAKAAASKLEDVRLENEIQRLNNFIDTLKQGNQKLINTVVYQAMQLAGELER